MANVLGSQSTLHNHLVSTPIPDGPNHDTRKVSVEEGVLHACGLLCYTVIFMPFYPVHGMVSSVGGLTKCMKSWLTLLQDTLSLVNAAKPGSGSDVLYLSNIISYPPAALMPKSERSVFFSYIEYTFYAGFIPSPDKTMAPMTIRTVWIKSVQMTAVKPPKIVNSAAKASKIRIEM